ncbi:MAG TPA: hypothetical protein VD996_04005, partial [Chitinophagaceae bacterium]|nr:hypothetical protein [Chitinophagaceae bacterium]
TCELDQWLTKIYLEGGGGGQNMESYLLAWLFAARHTSTDCFEKRAQKGFVFTIGDEWNWDQLSAADITRITGVRQSSNVTAEQLLQEALMTNHVFHIHINEGSYRDSDPIIKPWKKLLGERFIKLEDHRVIAETIASAVAVVHGLDLKSVARTFDTRTAAVVSRALAGVKSDIVKQRKGIISL